MSSDSIQQLKVEDGSYTIEVTLDGGSGRASIQSPCGLEVSGTNGYATIVWSSPNYDYMIVGSEKYLPVNEGGNSEFEIPVLVYDEPMPVLADTTAMSVPHEIEYNLTFDSTTLKDMNGVPVGLKSTQTSYGIYAAVILAVIAIGAGAFVKKIIKK